jgi:microcompartment protein CcmL/EutN
MTGTIGLLEITGLTPAMVAIDVMAKAAAVDVLQIELNDFYGVCVKISGTTADVQTAVEAGHRVAGAMSGAPVSTILTRIASEAVPAVHSRVEFSPLIHQNVVIEPYAGAGSGFGVPPGAISGAAVTSPDASSPSNETTNTSMDQQTPAALGFIETQGFTAVFEAIDTACKAASVEVVGKEKLGGGYVTVIIQGQLSAVTAAIDAGKEKVNGLGKLIAAHVIARPSEAVLRLLPKI